MKYNAAKAAVLTIIIGVPFSSVAAEKASLADDMGFAAFRGIETMDVTGGELKRIFGERGTAGRRAPRGGAGGPPPRGGR